jgi:3-dehydroquinate dehydratase-2
MTSLLVLHGPNLARVAAEEIDPLLESRAEALELELTIVQSNGEPGLLDALHAHAGEVDAVLVNPGVLAPTVFALAEALQLLELPSVEVLLKPLAAERGPSSLASVVRAQVHGKGVDGYAEALELLVQATPPATREKQGAPARVTPPPAARSKTIGRKVAPPAASPPPATTSGPRGKTIGRGSKPQPSAPPLPTSALTRAQVIERINRRMKGDDTPDALAAWARETWTALQRGAACEAGAKDALENVLLTLMAGAKATDAILVAQIAKLDT